MLVYVVRHGESEDDLDGRYAGAADFPLLESGRQQALGAAQSLKSQGIQAIYTSPLARAKESAEVISREIGDPPVEVVFDLRERNTFGVLSGHTPHEARRLFGYLLDAPDDKPGAGTSCAPGGEEYNSFINRVSAGFEQVVKRAEEAGHTSIALVLHRRFTLGLFTEVLHLGDAYEGDHGSVNVIEYHRAKLLTQP